MDVTLGIARSHSYSGEPEIPIPELSALERSVLKSLACGFQSKEIAKAIGRKKPTVEGYIRVLYVKFGAKSRAHLVACAYRAGVLAD